MKSLSKTLILVCVALLLSMAFAPAPAQAQQRSIGSVAASRGNSWTLNGSQLAVTVQKLLSPSNFGPGGTVSCEFTITSTASTITEALLSQFDVFFIGYFLDGTFSTSELQAMENWVNSGGKLLITADSGLFDDVAAHFGYPSSNQGVPNNFPAPGQSNHPVFDGPFGTISQYTAFRALGFFANTAGATVLGRDASGNATLLEKDIGAGKIIISGDICTIGNIALSSGTGISTNNDIFMANLFSYIAGCSDTNQPPDCSNAAIGDQTVGPSGQATLSGGDVTGIPDPDGDPLTITVSPSNLGPGVHTVTVTADDGNGGTCSKDVTVRVFPALPHGLMLLANKDIQIDSPALSEGDLHANDDIRFQNGNPSTHSGNVTAVDDIRIKRDNTIDGDVAAGGELQVEPGATVTGTQTENASVASLPLPSLAFTTGGDNVRVPKNGSRSLAPGSYGNVKVRRGGTLNLENDGSGGEYFFDRLRLDKGATLAIDANAGEVTINVKNDIVFAKNSEVTINGPAAGIETRFVTFNCTDDMRIDRGARVLGNLIAPRHHVFLKKESVFKGAICARTIHVEDQATVLHHNATSALPKRVLLSDADDEMEAPEYGAMPADFALEQNYPNPFNPTTTIAFSLPQAGEVSLKIYNLQGQLVATLHEGALTGGRHQMVWNGTDVRGNKVASGIYVYRLETAEFVATKKLTMMK